MNHVQKVHLHENIDTFNYNIAWLISAAAKHCIEPKHSAKCLHSFIGVIVFIDNCL